MEDRKILDFRINEINKYLSSSRQWLRLITVNNKNTGLYYELYWDKKTSIDEYEEFIFSGDTLDIQTALSGISYGIRIEQYKAK